MGSEGSVSPRSRFAGAVLRSSLTVNVLYGVGVYVEEDFERHNRDYCHMKDRTMRLMKQVGA